MKSKRIVPVLIAILLCSVPSVHAGETYQVDPAHSDVIFKIRHLVSNVTGNFRDFSGTLDIDRSNLTHSSVEFTIETASIDTANERRDTHLRSADFFDVEKFPEITFKSTKITKAKGDTYDVKGEFTMHGITKEIVVPVEVMGFASHERFGERAGFTAMLSLDRNDYGIGWNMPMGADSVVLGEDVYIEINIEAFKPQ
ncbi:MAG: YceI family protein [Acidobacteriota bacterium]|nr:YceI family protein [Acidobacteriota bacterium]